MNVAVAAAAAGVLALAARAVRWLTLHGTVAAWLVGTAVFAGGDLTGAALLALFFVSGSLFTFLGRPLPTEAQPAGGRTGRQVVANGIWPAVGAGLIAADATGLGWAILTGALATAQADTWATEIGAYASHPPRLITTGRPVRPGTSGGVTVLGTIGGLTGAFALAGAGALLGVDTGRATAAFVGGTLGMLADSVLGASAQQVYYCEECRIETEHSPHRCGRAPRPLRPWAVLDNHGVNFVASGLGGGSALLFSSL